MDEHPADETRLDAARRIYHALRVQYPDRFIILVDPHGRVLARSDWRYAPLVHSGTH
jgi:hypothetical protein